MKKRQNFDTEDLTISTVPFKKCFFFVKYKINVNFDDENEVERVVENGDG